MAIPPFIYYHRLLVGHKAVKGLAYGPRGCMVAKLFHALSPNEKAAVAKGANAVPMSEKSKIKREIADQARALCVPLTFVKEQWASTDETLAIPDRIQLIAATMGICSTAPRYCRYWYIQPMAFFMLRTVPQLQSTNIPQNKRRAVAKEMYRNLSPEQYEALLKEVREINLKKYLLVPKGASDWAESNGLPIDLIVKEWHNPLYANIRYPPTRVNRIAIVNGLAISQRHHPLKRFLRDRNLYERSLELNLPFEIVQQHWYKKTK